MNLLSLFPKSDPESKIKAQLAKEARGYAGLIIRKLDRLGVCYRYKTSEKKHGLQSVKFNRAVTTPEAIYLEIDTLRLPRGISLSDLCKDEILDDLTVTCRRPIRFRKGTDSGAWLIVEREVGAWGIPRKLTWSDVINHWPEHTSKPLLVPMGVGENRKLVYRSLANMPHALVGGATGAGKTTLLHVWTCSLLMHNSPDQLHLIFIDLKGGAEAQFYEGVPHLVEDGIIYEKEKVIPALELLYETVEKRLEKFRRGKVQNIAAWNYTHRQKLPRMLLIIDELANVMLDKSLKGDAEPLLADLSARGRAPGVHIVLATQRPEVAVVTGLIKANMDGRLAFRMTDQASSRTILDTTEAARFDDTTPLGRFIYKRGLDRYEIQAPLITPGQIKSVIARVKAGEVDTKEQAMTPEEIFKFALENMGGSLARQPLYQALGGKVTHHYLKSLSAYDGELIELEGQTYIINPPDGGKEPRRIELVSEV